MKMVKSEIGKSVLCVLVLGLLIVHSALGDSPRLLNFQGRLNDASGNPIVGSKTIAFSLYNQASGGGPLWTETQTVIISDEGLYSVLLGSITTLSLDFDVQYYLGITISGESEMTPRFQLASTAYALNTISSINNVKNGGGNINLAAGTNIGVSSNDTTNTITFNVPNVTSSWIQDGTITTADLAFTPLTNPYTGNVTITGGLDLTDNLNMNLADITNVDDIRCDDIKASDIYLGYNHTTGSASDGTIYIYDDTGNEHVLIDSDWNNGGFIRLKNDAGKIGVTMASRSDYGQVLVCSDTGYATINLSGGSGTTGGSVTVNGTRVHDYADVFSFVASANPKPGQVVSIASDGKLDVSSAAYDSKVVGIVSGAGNLSPGMIVGGNQDDPHTGPIAVSGRVYCYVDATDQAVEIGDLLTTSNTPGHAMKAIDRERAFGAVLGKAMQPLQKGQKGLVLVLVCLN